MNQNSSSVWGTEKTKFFASVTPEKVLDAIEALGFKTSGRVMQMGSMENRVYEVEVDCDNPKTVSENFRIIKFYRPGRWSKSQIQDEHDFLFDLIKNDIHAIPPIKIEGESVFENEDGLLYTIFHKKGGRACVEWNDELLGQMGRLLARLHNVGQTRPASNRLKLDIKTFGENNLELILQSNHMLPEYRAQYESICQNIFKTAENLFNGIQFQRIHGDCHHGNILLNENKPFLIDFDDMSMGPRVQDLWMIAPGRDEYSIQQRNTLIDAYSSMTEFNYKELRLVEVLRSLRIIHFSAWIGHRFEDEAFKRVFPTYATHQYWEKEIFDLREQLGYIQDSLDSMNQY